MAIRCPNCKGIFDDEQSYQNHLPCESSDEFLQEYAKKGDTGER